MLNYTLPDFRGDDSSPGKRILSKIDADTCEEHLSAYCKHFMRVLKGGFGQDKNITATIFRSAHGMSLPYRLVAFELGGQADMAVKFANIDASALLREFERLDHVGSQALALRRGIYNERVARVYDSSSGIPTIFIIKPDMARYWTRSAGLNDGDEVALDLFRWQQAAPREKALQ